MMVKKNQTKETNPLYVSENGLLYSKDKKSLWYVPNYHIGSIEIADTCETLEKGSFYAFL